MCRWPLKQTRCLVESAESLDQREGDVAVEDRIVGEGDLSSCRPHLETWRRCSGRWRTNEAGVGLAQRRRRVTGHSLGKRSVIIVLAPALCADHRHRRPHAPSFAAATAGVGYSWLIARSTTKAVVVFMVERGESRTPPQVLVDALPSYVLNSSSIRPSR